MRFFWLAIHWAMKWYRPSHLFFVWENWHPRGFPPPRPCGGRQLICWLLGETELTDKNLNCYLPTAGVDSQHPGESSTELIKFLFSFFANTLWSPASFLLCLVIYFQTWAFGRVLICKASVYLLSSFLWWIGIVRKYFWKVVSSWRQWYHH